MEKFATYAICKGWYQIHYNEQSIIGISYVGSQPHDLGEKTRLTEETAKQLEEYFTGKRQKFNLPIQLNGTEFQKRVWMALCAIPYGETRSYKEIAEAIGNPKACRAVGMANHRNPIMIVVPCHRVIGANGGLTGYAGGLSIKKSLLELEKQYK